ncbi:hypothetical protein VTJ83DRAFT_6454 [Remersonia thermophila]|uniref:Uncharacterized protein n=1 Tax=Remersonia thermophila TaxID=72144 RepID=A0ABR4D5P9_9PEZI
MGEDPGSNDAARSTFTSVESWNLPERCHPARYSVIYTWLALPPAGHRVFPLDKPANLQQVFQPNAHQVFSFSQILMLPQQPLQEK